MSVSTNCISVQLDCFLLLVSQSIVSVGHDSSDNTWEKSSDYLWRLIERIHRNKEINESHYATTFDPTSGSKVIFKLEKIS